MRSISIYTCMRALCRLCCAVLQRDWCAVAVAHTKRGATMGLCCVRVQEAEQYTVLVGIEEDKRA